MVNWTEIDRLVVSHSKEEPTASVGSLSRFLKKWFCIKYNLPFKTPILDSYTLDELVYEYLTFYYLDPKNDPLRKEEEKQKQDADMAWVREQMMIEAEKIEPRAEEPIPKPVKSSKKSKKKLDKDQEFPDTASTKFDIE